MAEMNEHVGRTSDHYKVEKRSPDRQPDLRKPRVDEIPDVERELDDKSDERHRQERGNRGPDEEPGFGQGA